MIQGVNAIGWAIPPFIIFQGKNHLSAWYKEDNLPNDWVIAVSENGWTTNKLSLEWLKHFDAHTEKRTIGNYHLLTIDGHKSHNLLDFQQYCKENKIITLCMPPHLSHLLQPLNVGCFSPLKKRSITPCGMPEPARSGSIPGLRRNSWAMTIRRSGFTKRS